MSFHSDILLETRHLAIGYPKLKKGPLFSDLNLELRKGSLTCLMGPNGAGKSTLIKTLTGLIPDMGGDICYLGDRNLLKYPRKRAKIFSVVLTGNSGFGILSVRDIVAIGRHPHTKWTGTYSQHDFDRVDWALEAVSATHLADRLVHTLSDGERQRVMIARALAQDTPIIYLDEPTVYLDLPHKIELMHILRKLVSEEGLTLLISTHELEMALQYADQMWLFGANARSEVGTPEDLLLSGKLESVFSRDQLLFDRSRGSFRSKPELHVQVSISGDDVAVKWTRNALEKIGVGVNLSSDEQLRIEVRSCEMEQRFCWKIEFSDSTAVETGESMQHLLLRMRHFRDEVLLMDGVQNLSKKTPN